MEDDTKQDEYNEDDYAWDLPAPYRVKHVCTASTRLNSTSLEGEI